MRRADSMQQPAKQLTSSGSSDFPGFFDIQEMPGVSLKDGSGQTDRRQVGVKEAAKLLGITERSVWRRIKQNKLTAQLVDGHTIVSLRDTDIQSDITPTRPDASVRRHTYESVELNTHGPEGGISPPRVTQRSRHPGATLTQPSRNHDETVTQPSQNGDVARLIDLVQSLQTKLEGATYRNGYLESQIEEREKKIQLLTDSLHRKRSWWRRFGDWLKGSGA